MKEVLLYLINILWFALFAQIIISWLMVAGVRNELLFKLNSALVTVTWPLLRPLRRVVPLTGAFDLTYLVAFLVLALVRQAIIRNL
ncbi:MAG: YggT family protein [Chloroflexi bacterium]|nr:YggT family protein [Chloroflexota bacterium]